MGKFWLLTSLFLVFSYTAGVTEVVGEKGNMATSQTAAAAVSDDHVKTKEKKVKVADGDDSKFQECNLEDNKPIPTELTADAPKCAEGVEDPGAVEVFSCINVGFPPNQTCPWYLENRMGCNAGGSAGMCDTVPSGGGTACKCVP